MADPDCSTTVCGFKIAATPTSTVSLGRNRCPSPNKYRTAIQPCNDELDQAIADLNQLSQQISSFAQSPEFNISLATKNDVNLSSNANRPVVDSSVRLIQELLAETKQKCAKMVEDNVDLATNFDRNISSCQRDLDSLRGEITYAHRCVNDLEVNLMVNGSATESDQEAHSAEQQMEAEIHRLREENGRLKLHLRVLQRQMDEGEELGRQISRLSDTVNDSNVTAKIAELQAEVVSSKETITALQDDRKRLKAEKIELLNQMKEVFFTLECKERELRDFIRQYEQKMRDSDKGLKELLMEKEQHSRDLALLEETVKDYSESTTQLKSQLTAKDLENDKLRQQIKELQGRFTLLTGHQLTLQTADSTLISTSETTPSLGYVSLPVSPEMNESNRRLMESEQMSDNRMDMSTDSLTKSMKRSESVKHPLSSSDELTTEKSSAKKTRSRKEFSSEDRQSRLSRFLGFGHRQRKESHCDPVDDPGQQHPIAADLSLAEKADQLIEARRIPMGDWKLSHLLAWLDLELGMQQYSKAFAENIKSGRVLLSITDNEIESALRIVSPLHKRKIRLAIEDYRSPAVSKFPLLRDVTHLYVCNHFLPAIGLPQYTESFKTNLIDGRLLNQLQKKQLEKHLGVTKKIHQQSILRGVDLLRKLHFDTKGLAKRRIDCDKINCDLIVWTNARLKKWATGINLQEYVENLNNSGLHGALLVLEPSVTVDTVASVLGIPKSKEIVRKHFISEYNTLVLTARVELVASNSLPPRQLLSDSEDGGSLGRTFNRSYTTSEGFCDSYRDAHLKKRSSFRGSIGRVFGLKTRRAFAEGQSSNDCSPAKDLGNSSNKRSASKLTKSFTISGSPHKAPDSRKSYMTESQTVNGFHMDATCKSTQSCIHLVSDDSNDSAFCSMIESTSNTSTKASRSGDENHLETTKSPATVVAMREKHNGPEGQNRPHSVAEWSPSRTVETCSSQRHPKVTFIDDRISQTPGGLKRNGKLPQFTSDQIQHWLSLEDFRHQSADQQLLSERKSMATTSLTALNGTPPVKPARRIGTICESELETEEILESKPPTANDFDVLRSFSKPQMYSRLPKTLIPAFKWGEGRKPTRIQMGLQSPSRRDRPTSLQLVTAESTSDPTAARAQPHETDL